MKKGKNQIISCLLSLIILTFTVSAFAQGDCTIEWSGAVSGSVPTTETFRTEAATSQAFSAIMGFDPYICLDLEPYSCADEHSLPSSLVNILGEYYYNFFFSPPAGTWDVVCASDIDGDGIPNELDDCPNDAENDLDSDGVCGDIDNCPGVPNSGQEDADSDGMGDVCDSDNECILEWWTNSSDCESCGGLMQYTCSYDCDFTPAGSAVTAVTIPSPQAALEVYQQLFSSTPAFEGDCYRYDYMGGYDGSNENVCLTGTWSYYEWYIGEPTNSSFNSSSSGGWDISCPWDDEDNDGVLDTDDNCPQTCNPVQLDADSDSVGDVCDSSPGCGGCGQPACEIPCDIDADSDGVLDSVDNCPNTCNTQQTDADGDNVGDVCDDTPGCGGCGQPECEQDCMDTDGDGISDSSDNCPDAANTDQADLDSDGIGNVCDSDFMNYGLVAYYPFNGNANDESGTANNGTVNGAVLTADRNGHSDSAYSFDGVDDYIEVADSNSLDNTNKLTISAWIKPLTLTTSSAAGILSKRVDSSEQYAYGIFFWEQQSGKLNIDIDSTNDRFQSITSFSENNWYHIAVVYDGTIGQSQRVKVYINGNLDIVSEESSSSIPNYSSSLYIGNLPAGSSYFNGTIDDIRIYNRVLSEPEIKNLYNE